MIPKRQFIHQQGPLLRLDQAYSRLIHYDGCVPSSVFHLAAKITAFEIEGAGKGSLRRLVD